MVELVNKQNNVSYYRGIKECQEIFIEVWHFGKNFSMNEVKEKFDKSDFSSGFRKRNSNIAEALQKPLNNLFQLKFYNDELTHINFNLWEYETLIKGKKRVNRLLKACCVQIVEYGFYLAVEPYDVGIGKKELEVIEKYVYSHIKELEELLKLDYLYMEVY